MDEGHRRRRLVQDLRYGWANGQRSVFVMFCVLLAVLVVSVVAIVVLLLLRVSGSDPPISIESEIEAAAPVMVGGSVRLGSRICNESDEMIPAVSRAVWIEQENASQQVAALPVSVVFDPGCHDFSADVQLPPDLDPGRWRREGLLTYTHDDRVFHLFFETEPFEVVE